MLSRLSFARGQNLTLCVLKFQPISAITTSAAAHEKIEKAEKTTAPASGNHPPEFPPPTSKRDFVNFPRPLQRENPPPVRHAFIPESWFQAFYPKTGYTGPYIFTATFLTTLLSKEYIVMEHTFIKSLQVLLFCIGFHYFVRPKLGPLYEKLVEKDRDALDGQQEAEKEGIRNLIKQYEGMSKCKDAVVEVTKGFTEVVQLQMEIAYRERLHEAYLKVKNKLDCQAELENVERRVAQKNLMDYVLRSVMKSLTPEMEKNSMQLCIKDLNDLAARS